MPILLGLGLALLPHKLTLTKPFTETLFPNKATFSSETLGLGLQQISSWLVGFGGTQSDRSHHLCHSCFWNGINQGHPNCDSQDLPFIQIQSAAPPEDLKR